MRGPRAAVASIGALLVLAEAAPAAADPVAPPAPMRDPTMVVAGSVLALAGGVAAVAGVVRLTVTAACPGLCPDPAKSEALGGALVGVGAAVLAGGVVLVVLGSRRPASVAGLPRWVGAPGAAGWAFRF